MTKQLLLVAVSWLLCFTTSHGWIAIRVLPLFPTLGRNSLGVLRHAYLNDESFSVNGKQQQQQQQEDFTGAGTLGDIMSRVTKNSTAISGGLVTTDGGVLQETYGISSPLDRMALTANGNLQRLFSSYYDAPVHVVVDTCHATSLNNTWHRIVHLTVFEQNICTATSQITILDDDCIQLVESKTVGLGQLFRYLDILPNFTLLDAGYQDESMWRIYELTCRQLSCRIEERFAPNIWNIEPRDR